MKNKIIVFGAVLLVFVAIYLYPLFFGKLTVKSPDGNKIDSKNYVSNGVVKKIKLSGQKYNYFTVTVKDFNGNEIDFNTYELTFNVKDTIYFNNDIAYSIHDKTNISNIK